jgi:uncharacterized protein YbjT (DUF2867 family)
MSVLLVTPPHDLGRLVVDLLISQDDEVRIIEPRAERVGEWRALGAHIAHGLPDADLVERAAQNVRTVVVFDMADVEAVVEGAGNAGVGRIVICSRRAEPNIIDLLAASNLDYVVLATGRVPRRGLGLLAEAIDAADDLTGAPRMVLDIRSDDARRRLRLTEETERPDL